MKLLWVKSGGLVPLDHGGKIRSYHLARALARQHELGLFTFYQPMQDDPHEQLKEFFSHVVCVPLKIPERNSGHEYLAYARNLFSNQPYSATKYCQPHVADRLRQHLKEQHYDLIICDFLLTAKVIPWETPAPKVLFTHNVEAMIWERQFQVARNPVWKAACYREFLTMEHMERYYLNRAEHVLTVSEADRNVFANFIDPSKMSVIPTGVDVEYFRPLPNAGLQNNLVFTGSMDWLANEDGILFFAEKILPLIRKEIPDAVLWVVGRRPTARVRKLAEDSGIRVTGTVDDIRPYIAQGSVYVVPLLVGGGTRIKIFEAMAMGKAVVSTTIGAEGLPVRTGENIVIADQAEQFAREVVALLRDSKRRNDIGRAAQLLVEQNYSWESVGNQLSDVLTSVYSDSHHAVEAIAT